MDLEGKWESGQYTLTTRSRLALTIPSDLATPREPLVDTGWTPYLPSLLGQDTTYSWTSYPQGIQVYIVYEQIPEKTMI